MGRKAEIYLDFQEYTDKLPMSSEDLYAQAASNDRNTISAWKEQWLSQIRANKERFGSFMDHSMKDLWGMFEGKPTIIAGSGPSLKVNAHLLKDRKNVPLISCLHNFHYFEDLEVYPDFYVTLDSGEITIKEVSEGGSKSEEEYWAATEKHKLLAFIGTHPKLLEKWRGKIFFFNAPIPDPAVFLEIDKIELYTSYLSCGGNVLGACLYAAKLMGSFLHIFVGADFSFAKYDVEKPKFHAWNSSYDKGMGATTMITDIYGNKVHTWPSYNNFKCFFEYIAVNQPNIIINASEGGCFGSHPHGNLMWIRQMTLKDALGMCNFHYNIEQNIKIGNLEEKKIFY